MITTYEDSPKFWQRTWFLALLIGVGVGVGIWWWQMQRETQAPAPVAASAVRKAAPAKSDDAMPDSALLVPPTIGNDGRPSDFMPEEWAALKDAMKQTPNPRSELERVVKYLRFQKAFEQWQSLQEGADLLTRRKLAEKLLEQIPERLAQSEVTYGEAMLLQASLLADIEPNEGLRQQRIEQAQAALKSSVPAAEPSVLDPEYKRREAAIVAAYQALPESRRDPSQLTKDLDAARVAVYGGKK
jgi:hypothetical protein